MTELQLEGPRPEGEAEELVPEADAEERLPRLCLLYTSDAADERSSVDLGGRRIIKKKNKIQQSGWTAIHIQKDRHTAVTQ